MNKAKGVVFVATVVAVLAGFAWEQPVSPEPVAATRNDVYDPLQEMLHLERLPLEKNGVYVRYEGAVDKHGLNGDSLWMLYQDSDKEWVVFEHLGPGCILNFCKHAPVDDPEGLVFRFYFDGEEKPRYELRPELCGQITPFLAPFADMYIAPETQKPWGDDFSGFRIVRSFVPMPFAKSCRITSSRSLARSGWGHVVCHCYYDGRRVRTFERFDPAYLLARRKLSQCGRSPYALRAPERQVLDFELASGERRDVLVDGGAGLVAGIRIMTRDFAKADCTNLWLRAWWNGASDPAVDVPFGSLFSNELGYGAVSTWLTGSGSDGTYYCFHPMPFTDGARIEVSNRGGRRVRFDVASVTVTREFNHIYATTPHGTFCGRYHPPAPTKDGVDTVFADLPGRGHVVGSVLTGRQSLPSDPNLGFPPFSKKPWNIWEGDARIHLDGLRTPQVESDGSESYSSYGWGFWEGPQSNPFGGYDAIRIKDWCMTRHLIADWYPFSDGCRFGFEHGGDNHYPMLHAGAVFWYAYKGGATKELAVDRSPSATVSVELESVFEGELAFKTPMKCRGHYGVPAELSFDVPAGTGHLVVRRVSDQRHPRQLAKVYVNGREVADRPWYVPDSNPYHRWLEDDYPVPGDLLKRGARNTIRIEPQTSGGRVAFNDFGYRVIWHARPEPNAESGAR